MKKLPILAACVLFLAGCADHPGRPVASQNSVSPPGTNVGTSNPGVNQTTTNTTATRADDAGVDQPGRVR